MTGRKKGIYVVLCCITLFLLLTQNHLISLNLLPSRCAKIITSKSNFGINEHRQKIEVMDKHELPVSFIAYVVQDDDSIESICTQFNIDESTLFGTNSASDLACIRKGTVLRIPDRDGFCVKFNEYDTIHVIATLYSINPDILMKCNGIQSDEYCDISEIFIPGGHVIASIETNLNGNHKTEIVREYSQINLVPNIFTPPVNAPFSSHFGFRKDPFHGSETFHSGVDYPVKAGTDIRAAAPGVTVFCGYIRGYGNTVIICHGNECTTLYAHCGAIVTGCDSFVQRGELIAKSGNSGRSTAPHLHFEIRLGNIPQNPEKILQSQEF